MKTNLQTVAVLLLLSFSFGLRAQTNVALKKHTTSSGLENGGQYHDSLAVDGKGGASQMNGSGGCNGTCTRWSSAFSDPQWICINLGGQHSITGINLYWEVANGKDFKLQSSPDSASWTTIQTVTNNSAFSNSYTFSSASGKYIRMYGTARNTPYGYSLWEFEVYGTPVNVLPLHFTDFTTTANKNTVSLNWKAFTDQSASIMIERSEDAIHFLPIAQLPSSKESNGVIAGNFIDSKPVTGKNYYRLQMTESNTGSTIFSKVAEVDMGSNPTVSVFPNPVKDNSVHVLLTQLYSGKIEIALRNMAGVLIQKQADQVSNITQYNVNLQSRPAPGIYWLDVVQNQAVTHVKVCVE